MSPDGWLFDRVREAMLWGVNIPTIEPVALRTALQEKRLDYYNWEYFFPLTLKAILFSLMAKLY